MAKQEVAKVEESANKMPAYLAAQQGKTAKLGNIDQSDLIIPRVKLLQALSPEITEFDNARQGNFWHSLAGEPLGESLRFIPIVIRKSYVLWAPRGDDRGILARANDGIHWDKVDEEFEVKPKGSKDKVTWRTARTVAESGLDKFGSSIPGDDSSAPAASLTYNILAYFPDFPELSPAVILNTRSAVKKAKQLVSKIEMRPVDHFAQVYTMGVAKEQGDEGPYFNYNYTSAGFADEADYEITSALFKRFADADFRPSDDADEATETGGSDGGKSAGKF